jgi:hypothetical protein
MLYTHMLHNLRAEGCFSFMPCRKKKGEDMTSQEKRQAVCDKYATIIGRNIYSLDLRDYCFKKYINNKYYSNCSSSICYSYKEAGFGFGILTTAGIYQSSALTVVDVNITNGVPDISGLRKGDMLEFAGTDAERPLKIGHVEMYYGNNILCGHGSGTPSFKDLKGYCTSRYNSWAPGGWREGLVCVRRYIQDDGETETEADRLSGWKREADGWHFYLGNSGEVIRNSWYQDSDGKWYWFNADGVMVSNIWYQYRGDWYYLKADGAMVKGQQDIDGKWYYLNRGGRIATEPVKLTPDENGALQYPGMAV